MGGKHSHQSGRHNHLPAANGLLTEVKRSLSLIESERNRNESISKQEIGLHKVIGDKRTQQGPDKPLLQQVTRSVDKKPTSQYHMNLCSVSRTPSTQTEPLPTTPLPLADKKVTVHMSRGLLSRASENALKDLLSTETSLMDQLAKHEYPFENAVFEGGGVKGIAYIGAVKVSAPIYYRRSQ